MLQNPMNQEAHQAELKRLQDRAIQDLAARGITDADVSGISTEVRIDRNEVTGWTFTVRLHGNRPALRYYRANQPDAEVTCNGQTLRPLGAA